MPVLIDLVVVIVVGAAALRGWRRGGVSVLLRAGCVLAGLLGGLWLARLIGSSMTPVWHVLLGLACAVGGALVGAAVGRRLLSAWAAGRTSLPDRLLGVAVRGGGALLVCGLLAGFVVAFGPTSWAANVRAAAWAPQHAADVPVVGRFYDAALGLVDTAAPDDIAALVPGEATASTSSSTLSEVDAAVRDSVLEISADDCGHAVVGTGFVAADGLVVTNAHVVRGATSVRVGGDDASVVAFDERTDLAVLRVPGLSARPLTLASADAVNGTALAVVGYPEGGPRTVVGATVVQRMPVPNPGLAGGLTLHQSYRLHTAIKHGNSGSPLLDSSAQVVGVVNALAGGDGSSTGYAISVDELRPVLASAVTSGAVGTGTCTSS